MLTYRETWYHGWTIQHTWRTSDDRPGPDGFDRRAIRGSQVIEQGPRESWASFTYRLDVANAVEAQSQAFSSNGKGKPANR